MKFSMKKSLLIAMSACVFSNVSVAAINGDYHVVDDDLTADHNESNGAVSYTHLTLPTTTSV